MVAPFLFDRPTEGPEPDCPKWTAISTPSQRVANAPVEEPVPSEGAEVPERWSVPRKTELVAHERRGVGAGDRRIGRGGAGPSFGH